MATTGQGARRVGHAAWFLHMQGVLVPAAGGVGLVVTAYEQRTRPGQLQLRQSVDLTRAMVIVRSNSHHL